MRKVILTIALTLGVKAYSQQSILVINNYTAYDFHGPLFANPANSCVPSVGISYPANPETMIVPADSHEGNGLALMYKSYAEAGTNPLYPVASYIVQTATASPSQIRIPTHPILNPTGPVSMNTDWRHTKFQMYFKGTNVKVSSGGVNIPETYFNGNLGDGLNTCFSGQSYISTTYGDAEWFTITVSNIKYSYIQLY